MRNYDPYKTNGRWYRVFLESNGTAIQITESDIDVTLNGNYLNMPKDFHVVDRKYDINSIEHSGTVTIVPDVAGFADGTQGVITPVAKAFDWAYVYVFGYYV